MLVHVTWVAAVFSVLAGLLHVAIFVAESFRWRHPAVWRAFGVRSQQAADDATFFTFNQGFYNLFLAVGAIAGPVMIVAGDRAAGFTSLIYACASMVAAAAVLLGGGGRCYVRAATVQATFPALALVAALIDAGT